MRIAVIWLVPKLQLGNPHIISNCYFYDELAEPLPSPCEAYHWPYEAFRLSFE